MCKIHTQTTVVNDLLGNVSATAQDLAVWVGPWIGLRSVLMRIVTGNAILRCLMSSPPTCSAMNQVPTTESPFPPHGFVFDRGGFVLYGFVDAIGMAISIG